MNLIPEEKEERISDLLKAGKSFREIAREVGVAKETVAARAMRLTVEVPPRVRVGAINCDNCGNELHGDREFFRRTRRTKHKFCSHACYCDFYRRLRAEDQCKRCGEKRGSGGNLQRMIFSRGYCQYCYGLLRQYGFDEELVAAHETLQRLRKETKHGVRANDNSNQDDG